jgi:hypothetical protein
MGGWSTSCDDFLFAIDVHVLEYGQIYKNLCGEAITRCNMK